MNALATLKARMPAAARAQASALLRRRWRVLDAWAVRRSLTAVLERTGRLEAVTWLGRDIWQFPLDAWLIQEMITALRPRLIVETGTHRGGAAVYYALMLDQLGIPGEVVTVDVTAHENVPHPRVTYLRGSSTDPAIVADVRRRAASVGDGQVLVILDSDHRAEHVARELDLYAPLVPVGGYVHVQDGWVDQLRPGRGFGAGPQVAAKEFLARNGSFVRDTDVEGRYVLTFHPHGWLRRVALDDALQ